MLPPGAHDLNSQPPYLKQKTPFCFINWFINHTMYVINDDKKCLTNPHWFAGILKLLKVIVILKGSNSARKDFR